MIEFLMVKYDFFFARQCVAVRMEPEKKTHPRGICSKCVDEDGAPLNHQSCQHFQ